MKTWLGLLVACLGGCAANAADGALELSEHPGKTPALVVAVCGGQDGDLPAIAQFVEQTPWTIFCGGSASPGLE